MNNMWKLALGLIGCLIAIWVIVRSDNETYVVNYTTYHYNHKEDELVERQTKSCKVTIDGQNSISGKMSKIESQDILFETWDYELSISSIIVDSIEVNVVQRVD